MYQHLFFYLDHTLWDFEKNSEATMFKIYEDFKLADIGIPDFETYFKSYCIHNDILWERYRNGFIKRTELRWKRMWLTLLDFGVKDHALSLKISEVYLDILPTNTHLMPGAIEILEHCKGKYNMHLITNGFETTQQMKLKYSGIDHYFEALISSEKSMSMKPKKEIYDFALQTTGATLNQSIMIGDALAIDVLGAKNAGMDQVYYNPYKIPHTEQPTYEVAHLAELKNIFI